MNFNERPTMVIVRKRPGIVVPRALCDICCAGIGNRYAVSPFCAVSPITIVVCNQRRVIVPALGTFVGLHLADALLYAILPVQNHAATRVEWF